MQQQQRPVRWWWTGGGEPPDHCGRHAARESRRAHACASASALTLTHRPLTVESWAWAALAAPAHVFPTCRVTVISSSAMQHVQVRLRAPTTLQVLLLGMGVVRPSRRSDPASNGRNTWSTALGHAGTTVTSTRQCTWHNRVTPCY